MAEYIAPPIEPDSDRNEQVASGQVALTVVDCALVTWGAGRCLWLGLHAVVRSLSWPTGRVRFTGLVIGLVLFWLVPARLLHAIPRLAIWCIAGVWLLSCAEDLFGIFMWFLDWDHRQLLNLMVLTFGLLLVWSNDGHRLIAQYLGKYVLRIASWARNRVRLILTVALLILWLFNPEHSHDTCMKASRLSEEAGAYRAAIVFTTLARDTFPPPTLCGTCFFSIRQELTARITYLKLRAKGHHFPQANPGHANGPNRNASNGSSWVAAEDADD